MSLAGLKSRCWQSWFFLEAIGENLFPFLFQLLEALCILVYGPFLCHPSQQGLVWSFSWCLLSHSDSSSPLPQLRLLWLHQEHLSILRSAESQPSFQACVQSRFSHVQFFVTPWTVAHQAPLCMRVSRQEYWSGLPFPSPPPFPPHLPNPRDWTCISHVSCICRRILYH